MDHSFLLHSVALLIVMFSFSFLGATTGGSSFLTVPACIFFGFAPSEAIATTRVGVLGSSAAGWHGFKNKAKVNTRIGVSGAVFASCGAILGAYFMISLSPAVLQRGLGILTLIILVLTLLRKRYAQTVCAYPLTKFRKCLGYTGLSGVGFLSGMFGGQGILLNYILTSAFKQPFLEAAGTRTIINFFVTIVAIIIYQESGAIDWQYAIVVLVGMTAGAYFGTLYGLKKGEKWAEKIFIIVAFLMALKLIF